MAKLNKADKYFHKKFAESLQILEEYQLKATIRHDGDFVFIRMTYSDRNRDRNFPLQHATTIVWGEEDNDSIDKLATEFFGAFPRLRPMLDARKAYMAMTGVDLDIFSLDSLGEYSIKEKLSDAELDPGFDGLWLMECVDFEHQKPLSYKCLEKLTAMYGGATFCHSTSSMLAAFMTRPSTNQGPSTPSRFWHTLDGDIWSIFIDRNEQGIGIIPAYKTQQLLKDKFNAVRCTKSGRIEFNWTGVEDDYLVLTWTELKTAFNIDRELYEAHASCSSDPLTVLKACLATLQLDSGRALALLAADFNLSKCSDSSASQKRSGFVGRVSRHNPWFQEQFEDDLGCLAEYGLKATLRQNNECVFVWLACGARKFSLQFTGTIALGDVSEETLEEVATNFCDALPALFPMLEARKRYVAWSGKELDADSLASLHNAWNDFGDDEDFDVAWDLHVEFYDMVEGFCTAELEFMTSMYVGATVTHSKMSAFETFLTRPSTKTTHSSDGYKYSLAEGGWSLLLQEEVGGFAFQLICNEYGPSTDFEIAYVNEDSEIAFNLPEIFEEKVHLTWAQLEQRFGITKILFDVSMMSTDGPLQALKSVYHHVNTEPMTPAMLVAAGFDFNDTSGPVGDAFPAESNASAFAILA